MELFKNQERALKVINTHDKGIVHHICGSGKSLVYKTAAGRVGRTLVFVPRKVLVEQFYQDYFTEDDHFDVVKINSDQKKLNGAEAGFWSRFNTKGQPARPMVALVNYQSINRLLNGMGTEGKQLFDLVFHDESHNISGDGRMMNRLIEQKILGRKSFFFTATPNQVMLERTDIFGPVLDTYNFAEAVKDGIVKTFNTHIECLNQAPGSENTPLLWSIGQFILRQGLKRVVVYTNTVQERKRTSKRPLPTDRETEADDVDDENDENPDEIEIVEDTKKTRSQKRSEQVRASMALNTFQQDAMKTLPRGIKVDYITAKTSLDQRYHMFRRFRDESDNTTRMIVSCKTISEGVDLTSADGIVLLDSRSNQITTTQRILRCTRLTKKERSEKAWKPAVVLIPLVNYSTKSYREDEKFREWLHQFASGLECQFTEDMGSDDGITCSSSSSPSSLFPLRLMVGNNVNEIPYDPRERTDDPVREKVAKHFELQCGEKLSASDAWTCETGIFDFTCRMSEFHDPPYARNWDSPYFRRVYQKRARCVASNLETQWKSGMDLYKFAAKFTSREMNDSHYTIFEIKEREALKMHPNASASQFMKPGWTGGEMAAKNNRSMKPPRTGIPCKRGCRQIHDENDPDLGWRVTYREQQVRSADESMTVYYKCFDCGSLWKE